MSKRKRTTTTGKMPAGVLAGQIIKLFKRSPKKAYNARQIIKKLKIKNSKDSVNAVLENLTTKGKITTVRSSDKYQLIKHEANRGEVLSTTGTVDMIRSGAAFIESEDLPDNDIYVPAKHLNHALHGDKVKVTYRLSNNGKRPEGRIVEIIERATEYFTGTLYKTAKYGYAIPDMENMPTDIYIPLESFGTAKAGDKVVIKIIKWQSRTQKSPIGEVVETLGKPGSSDAEMKSILIQSGFELSFPPEVIEASETLSTEITEAEIAKRRDIRDVLTFTIDPDTAKDFDDAISFRYLDNGECEIGVHIADVTHYVKDGGAIDKEALKRSTSVYLVDRVLPMLPEKLSNELCSLRPDEDSLCFSAIFTFDKNQKLKDSWFGKTIIHSDRRFTYEEAQEVLDTGEGDYVNELKVVNKIAHKLRKQRFKNGAISFESPEVKFRLDENAAPVEVYVKERKDTHLLIEDFMLLANKKVAEKLGKLPQGTREIPFVYRVHDTPDPDKVAEFAKFAQALGYTMHIDTPEQIAKAYNNLHAAAEENPQLKMLEPLAIRTMAKAEYTTDNIGHYGLGFEHYTHFTSPIRRYSDVLVHRILEKNLTEVYRVDKEKLQIKCKHISSMERKAMDAERQSVKYKQVEFIQKHIGEVFKGRVAGLSDRGIFVEMEENLCEGFVPFDSLNDDFTMADNRLSATGRHTKTTYKMGDTLTVKVISANLNKRQITLALEDE